MDITKGRLMKAIIYARFSPRPNAADSESIEVQVARCQDYCKAHRYAVNQVYEDRELSGGRADNRPGLQAALKTACDHKAILVVYSLSRLARNTRDAIDIGERLNRSQANLASLSEKIDTKSPMGRFFFILISALAQLEREQTAQRTSDAMQTHQSNGRRMGSRPPYGQKIDPNNSKQLVVDSDEVEIIQVITGLRNSGKGYRAIARELDVRGIETRTGGPWAHTSIRAILQRVKQYG